MDDFLPNDLLSSIGYKAGDTELLREDERVYERREDYSDLQRFIVEVAGFSRKSVKDLTFDDEEAEKYNIWQSALREGRRLRVELIAKAQGKDAGEKTKKLSQQNPDTRVTLEGIKNAVGAIPSRAVREATQAYLMDVFDVAADEEEGWLFGAEPGEEEGKSDRASRVERRDADRARRAAREIRAFEQRSRAENFKLTILLKPHVVSAVSMAYQKLKEHQCVPGGYDLDGLMSDPEYLTHFAYLVALQMQMASYEHPSRYLTKHHINLAMRNERAVIMRFRRKAGVKRQRGFISVEDDVMGHIDNMQYLGSNYYYNRDETHGSKSK
jgi:hypothetical protein